MIERYGIYQVDLNTVRGSELAKTRPAVVISDDEMNAALQTVVVCPLTSTIHERWPSRVQTGASGKPAEVAVDQIRTVTKSRLGDRLGALSETEAEEVRHVITLMYGVLAK
jgi:mRNA interferase MazF